MPESWNNIQLRGQQSCGVWQAFAPAFTVGQLGLAGHVAEVALLSVRAQAVADQEAVVDEGRDVVRGTLRLIEDFSIRLPRMATGALPLEDALQNDIENIQGMVMNSADSVGKRGRRVLKLWGQVNVHLAALTPTVAALVVGGTLTVALLEAALERLGTEEQAVEDKLGDLREIRAELRTLATKVDRNNKRWYVAWMANFPVGTPAGDAAMAQVGTGQSGGGGEDGGGSSLALPTAPQNPSISSGAAGSGALSFSWEPAPPAQEVTGYNVYSETGLAASPTTNSVELDGFDPGAAVTLMVKAVNATGEGPASESAAGTAG